MKIGTLSLRGKGILAPMAGVSDRAFRELCIDYGAAYAIGEMASAKGISLHDKKSKELLAISDKERPAAVQIFGDDPETMARAAYMAMAFSPDAIDINMGCPAPKVASGGAGAALMKNPVLVSEIVRAVVQAVDIPVTVKIRAGWDEDRINAPEIAKCCEQSGAAAICVHGRTRKQMYAPPVHTEVIQLVKAGVSVPVIGNGDICNGADAVQMMAETGCDAVMVGRGALGRPWVFKQMNAYICDGTVIPEPPVAERMDVLKRHIEMLCAYKGDYIGMREARKHAAWYMKGIRGAAKYRLEIGKLKSLEELYALCEKVAENNSLSDEDTDSVLFNYNNFNK